MGFPRNNQKTQFSEHAYLRVGQRLSLDPSELADQLDYGFAISIHEEKNKDIVHRLFYSIEDAQCFVAIQNISTRMVVTILPVDYYEQRNPRIPPSLMQDAARLVSWQPGNDEPNPLEASLDENKDKKVEPTFFEVSAIVDKGSSWTKRTIKLKKWPALEYDDDVQRLFADPKFLDSTVRRSRRVMTPSERLVEVKVRISNKAPWVSLPLSREILDATSLSSPATQL